MFAIRNLKGPLVLRRLRRPEFLVARHMKVVRLLSFSIGCITPKEIPLVIISVKVWVALELQWP